MYSTSMYNISIFVYMILKYYFNLMLIKLINNLHINHFSTVRYILCLFITSAKYLMKINSILFSSKLSSAYH